MIKLIVLSVLINTGDSNIYATVPTEPIKIEAGRKRGKGQRGRKRGGSGLRQDGKKYEANYGRNAS